MTAYDELRTAYHDRGQAVAAVPAGRGKVVGLVGATIPVELVLATGAVPVTVAALPTGPTPAADRYLEAHFDDEARATLEAVLAGRYERLDLLVLTRTSDAYLELYYVLKEVIRLDAGAAIPPLHLYDLLHGRSDANREYGLSRLRELASRLEASTGQKATEDRLRAATLATNRQRHAINRVLDARRDPGSGISGVEAMTVIGAGRFLDPSRHAELLDAYLGASKPPLGRRPRVVLTAGVALSDLRVHEALEAAGALVVAEDDAWGSRAGGALIPADADDILAAIFDKYFLDVPSPRLAPAAARDTWLRSQLTGDVPDALVTYVPSSDRWFGWDYPRLRALAAEASVPTLLLRNPDPQPVHDFFAGAPDASTLEGVVEEQR